MRPVVIADKVAKKYSHQATRHLSYGVRDLARELLGRRNNTRLRADEFWAVDNVTFMIDPGEALAIIGRNGSGKTTLLKLICGLIKLDAGTIVCDGRVQALINLGAGFHMELSGIDNIYNSASLMGLSRREIASAAEEAIEFSELGKFIHSPVGTYSAGMQARLGFSVAVSLKPDILVVDEILAVGDQAFQNKCSVRLHQAKKDGVAILLVTHSIVPVIQLCDRALWLDSGRAMALGPAKATIQSYLDFLERRERHKVRSRAQKRQDSPPATRWPWVDRVQAGLRVSGADRDAVTVHDEVTLECSFTLSKSTRHATATLWIVGKDNLKLGGIPLVPIVPSEGTGRGVFGGTAHIPDLNVTPGTYAVRLEVRDGNELLYDEPVREFVVEGDGRLYWQIADLRHSYGVEPA